MSKKLASKAPYRLIFDIPIRSLNLKNAAKIAISEIEQEGKKTFFYINAHCLNIALNNNEYKDILKQASLVYSGGIGPVLASRFLGQPLEARTPTPDFIEDVFAYGQTKNWSVYIIGAKDQSLQKTVGILKAKFPKLDICGFHNGYFGEQENQRIIQEINFLHPTMVIVGMGTPKQEKWIKDNMYLIDTKVFWAVGAMIDVISGELPRAPLFMQKLNLEWLHRLCQEPKRLWKRYLIGNLLFIGYVIKYKLSGNPPKIDKTKLPRYLWN